MDELELTEKERKDLAMAATLVAERVHCATDVDLTFRDASGSVLCRTAGDSEDAGPDDRIESLVHQAIDSGETSFDGGAGHDHADPGAPSIPFAIPLKRRGRVMAVAAGRLPLLDTRTCDRPSEEASAAASSPGAARSTIAMLEVALAAEFDKLALAEDIKQMSRGLASSYEEISLLYRLSSIILIDQPPEEFFRRACEELLEVLSAEGVAVIMLPGELGAEQSQIITAGTLPIDPEKIPELCLSFTPTDGEPNQPIIKNRCEGSPQVRRLSTVIRNLVIVPLQQGHRGYGMIAAFNKLPAMPQDGETCAASPEFDSTDVKLISAIAGTSAIFVDNLHLYSDLKELMIGVIKALVSAIDAKDPYTCGHSERVAITARQIAQKMDMEHEVVENVYMAGLLHDIGKIGIPERILLKEGKLEPEERKIMQQHPVIGSKILSGIKRLEGILPGVKYHHERVDGSGYPEGLDRQRLPLMGCIIGLADAFDAMTSNRPYRPTMRWEAVLEEVRRNTGLQFDVRVVDTFFSLDLKLLMEEFMTRPTTYTGHFANV